MICLMLGAVRTALVCLLALVLALTRLLASLVTRQQLHRATPRDFKERPPQFFLLSQLTDVFAAILRSWSCPARRNVEATTAFVARSWTRADFSDAMQAVEDTISPPAFPLTSLYAATFPLQLEVLLLLPFSPLGAVHLSSSMVQHFEWTEGGTYSVECSVRNVKPHAKGVECSLETRVRRDGDGVSSDPDAFPFVTFSSTYLFFTKRQQQQQQRSGDAPKVSSTSKAADSTALPPGQPRDWGTAALSSFDTALDSALPLRWAEICLDYNPIHLSHTVARLLGFSSKIAHGMSVVHSIITNRQFFEEEAPKKKSTSYATAKDTPRHHLTSAALVGEKVAFAELLVSFVRPVLLPLDQNALHVELERQTGSGDAAAAILGGGGVNGGQSLPPRRGWRSPSRSRGTPSASLAPRLVTFSVRFRGQVRSRAGGGELKDAVVGRLTCVYRD